MILDQFQRYQELVSASGQEPDEAVRTEVSNLHQGLQRAALSPQQMALVLQLEGQWQRRNGALEEAGVCWLDSLACAFTVRVAFDWLELVLLERVKTTDPELQRVVAGLRRAGAGSAFERWWQLALARLPLQEQRRHLLDRLVSCGALDSDRAQRLLATIGRW